MFGLFRKNEESDINVNDIDDLIGTIELIDIREPYEYSSGSIKSAKNIPMDILLNDTEKYLSRDKKYYIICRSGARSARTCAELREQGYDVVNVSGGVISYEGSNRI